MARYFGMTLSARFGRCYVFLHVVETERDYFPGMIATSLCGERVSVGSLAVEDPLPANTCGRCRRSLEAR